MMSRQRDTLARSDQGPLDAGQVVGGTGEESGVLEKGENAEVAHEGGAEEQTACSCTGPRHSQRAEVVEGGGEEEEEEVERITPAVEEVTRSHQPSVACHARGQVVDYQDQGQESVEEDGRAEDQVE